MGGDVVRARADDVVDEVAAAAGPTAVLMTVSDAEVLAALPAGVPVVVADPEPTLPRALEAIERGATDYLPTRIADASRLRQRLVKVAARAVAENHIDRRLDRLRSAVRQLNVARRTVSQRVDVLCNDFIDGYGDVAREMEQVRLGKHLHGLLDDAADLEQLLCHLMDWLLRQVGDGNIAIFLDNDEGDPELAAYMKHTVPGEEEVVDWLREHVLPDCYKARTAAGKPAIYSASPEDKLPAIDPLNKTHAPLIDQAFLGCTTTYLGESLGTIVLFRRDDQPLTDHARRCIEIASEAFGLALTKAVREDDVDDDDDEPDEDSWWRNGDAAPF